MFETITITSNMIGIALIGIASMVIFIILIKYLRKISAFKFSFERIVLLITIPKHSGDKNKDNQQKSAKEMLKPMEDFFSIVAGLKAQKGIKSYLFGRSDAFSFEIVSDKDGLISFYFVIPKESQQFFEQQIQAQYPSANVEQVSDYNIFIPQGEVTSSYLKLKNYSMFPIKTYLKSETDLLIAVINSLSQIPKEDAACVQFVVQSAKKGWHNWGSKVAREMQQGKKLDKAISVAMTGRFMSLINNLLSLFGGVKQSTEQPKEHKLSPMDQEVIKSLEEKSSKAGLDVNIRIIVSSKTVQKAEMYLNNIINSFAQFTTYEYGNGFLPNKKKQAKTIHDFIYRFLDRKRACLLNAEEMASVFHLPTAEIQTPNINWLLAKKAPGPINIPQQGLFLGYNIFRGEKTPIRIKRGDRRRHMYVIGMTGVGKSWFIEGLCMQDIVNGEGACFIDPHGDAIDHLLERIPKQRAEDVILFDPADIERPLALNLLEYDTPEQKTFVVNEVMNIFDKLYDLKATGGPMFEQYFKNACLLIMDDPESGSTLLEVPKVLADEEFRKMKLAKCKTEVVKDFWEKQALKAGGEASLQNMVPYISSKLTPFIANDFMRPIISQQKSSLNFSEAMNNKKIILVKLSKGKIGDNNAYLLGMILIAKLLMAALGRGGIPEEERNDFYLYIDEFQNFLTDSMETILSEARKYRLCLTIAHQYIGQLVKAGDTKFKDAIFGNVGTKVAFRIGVDDAEALTKEFAPVFSDSDFLNMPKYTTYTKLLIDNANPPGFSMATVPFDDIPGVGDANPAMAEAIAKISRLKYGKDRTIIEREIADRVNKLKELE